MKITVRSDELTRALYRVQGIADKKSTMPALAHVLLEADDSGELRLKATDTDITLSGTYNCTVEVPGAAAVQARQLYDIVKTLKDQPIHLQTTDNHWLELKAGSGEFRLVGMAAAEYPTTDTVADMATFSIAGKDIVRMIDRTLFCVSTDDNRHNLSGVYCEARDGNTLRMVATDGHRLALADYTAAPDVDFPLQEGVIVPRKAFQELKRILSNTDDEDPVVEIGFSPSHGVMRIGRVELLTTLVQGSFPKYDQVIPAQSDKQIHITKASLGDALRRVSLLSQSRAHGVKLVLSEGVLQLIAEDPDIGTARESLPVEYAGEDLTIGFNARYILDILSLLQEESVCLFLSDDLSPAVLRPSNGHEVSTDYLAVVMPMRI